MPLPYGTGAYGVGKYSRDAAYTCDFAARADIVFGLAAAPGRTISLAAGTGVAFDAHAAQPGRDMAMAGAADLMFDAAGRLTWTWVAPGACHAGQWAIVDLANAA